MTTPETLVGRVYAEVWDRADEDVAREILAPDFRFRGSLGPEKTGVDGSPTICARCTVRSKASAASSRTS